MKQRLLDALLYLRSTKSLCYPVPCGNEQIAWSEVASRWKQLLKLISSSLKQVSIRCLPVENVSKPSSVHIIPIRGNQWNTKKWETSTEGTGERRPEGENSICVHLQEREIDHIRLCEACYIAKGIVYL